MVKRVKDSFHIETNKAGSKLLMYKDNQYAIAGVNQTTKQAFEQLPISMTRAERVYVKAFLKENGFDFDEANDKAKGFRTEHRADGSIVLYYKDYPVARVNKDIDATIDMMRLWNVADKTLARVRKFLTQNGLTNKYLQETKKAVKFAPIELEA